MSSKRSIKYLIASYTHLLDGKHTNLGGPAQHLAKYLGKKAHCIWQPIPAICPVWLACILKIRDIWLVLTQYKPADCFIGVEALNALLGRILGYPRVIYWNMDYSPTRGVVWTLLDRLAIHFSDEIWVLKDRGLPKQKVVPIGCWYYEIKRPKKPGSGIVYIGLLEDMQGVEWFMRCATEYPNLRFSVIGTGKDEAKYKAMNLPNVKFYGILSDREAQKILCSHRVGWCTYHKDNPTIKYTLPTKPMTYMSCGLRLSTVDWSRRKCLAYARKHDWGRIFKKALGEV